MRLYFTHIAIILLLAACSRNELIDKVPPVESVETGKTVPATALDAWVNDGANEPRIIAYSASMLTVQWPAIKNAVRYDVYSVSAFGPPIVETKLMKTADASIVLASEIDKQFRIKAVDAAETVLDSWVIQGAWNILVPQFVKGTFSDDFEDGMFNPAYYIRNATQAAETGGYMQLNQNLTDNGPSIRIGYDPEGKRFVRMTLKWFQHRNGDNYSGGIRFASSENNNDILALYNAHDVYPPAKLGTLLTHDEYEPHDYSTLTRPRIDLNSMEYFDAWFVWDVIMDLDEGTIRVIINGVKLGSFDTPYVYNDKVLFYLDCYGWGTGHYVRMDDLVIESSDTPY